MKKYLREIEVAGMILLAVSVVLSLVVSPRYSMWPCAVGLLLWLAVFLYRAFHWQEYERENKQSINILLIAIVILIAQMLLRR